MDGDGLGKRGGGRGERMGGDAGTDGLRAWLAAWAQGTHVCRKGAE